ncbi:LPS export ABC transporter periplasmic protein LptC [Pseudomonas fluvialis]|uniref:Lipopolysaccharide export system protein LptC n=1 Tax=Pseudomonas fluvialis TaxID=1793966 RepID=A0ABQ2AKN5_9PSED|nr:LPS export ABC transporter periplasmic protein LptC [Pseudomonas fluvialis]OXM41490.1 LPS export ABC transporter periplasmic protein LptC [Pseudomonas fluvialis]GGH93091.1 lipopolysaccharide export system protein LptC [Pseudomonas fluvialis]
MKRPNKNLRPVLLGLPVLIGLLALGYWNIRPETFLARTANTSSAEQVDFYIIGTETVQYQADGTLDYRLQAPRLEHLQRSELTLVEQPDLLLYRGNPHPWHVQSTRGEAKGDGSEVELIDNVRIARTDARGRPTLLTTSRLTVFPDKEYAETRQAVRIDAANGVTTAQGMKAYLQDSRMHLLSNVRGQHEVR